MAVMAAGGRRGAGPIGDSVSKGWAIAVSISDIAFWGVGGGAGRRWQVRWLRGTNPSVWAETRRCRPGGSEDRILAPRHDDGSEEVR